MVEVNERFDPLGVAGACVPSHARRAVVGPLSNDSVTALAGIGDGGRDGGDET
jgi:hypothetical protein